MHDRVTIVVQHLEQNAGADRIKKLLIYASSGHWESDPVQLQQVDLASLLTGLRQMYPTLQQLQFRLQALATNLTKPHVYQPLVEVIVAQCQQLYPVSSSDSDHVTQFFGTTPVSQRSAPNLLFEQQAQIANGLSQHPSRDRIAKMLLCLTQNHWESDLEKVSQLSMRGLISDVWRLFPSLDEVQRALFEIVQRLSKAIEYQEIAVFILQQLALLYAPSSNQPEVSAVPKRQPQPGQIFDLRFDVMQFTNPLRAKILLFSLLHQPFDQSSEAWTALKHHSLDTLLKQLIAIYPLEHIPAKLQAIVQTWPNPDEYLPVADAIVSSLKRTQAASPPSGRPMSSTASSEDSTQVCCPPTLLTP
jgi:hypothetical protein